MYRKSSFAPSTGSYKKKPRQSSSIKNKPVIIAMIMTILLLIIVIVLMMFLPRGGNQSKNQDMTYTIGQNIHQIGTIYSTGNRSFYYELDYDDKVLGLKSNTLDLGVYTGTVQISGSVQDVIDNIPIVLVDDVQYMDDTELSGDDEISDMSGDQDTGSSLTTQKKYFFGQYGLYIDFSNYSGYVAKQSGSAIVVSKVSDGDQPVETQLFKISPYSCVEGNNNCDQQLSNASNGKVITNSQGVKFYNLTESENWLFFNGGLWGYKIAVSDENEFTKLSKSINIFSEDSIKSKINSVAKQTCKKSTTSMSSVTNVDITSEKSVLYAYVSGTDSKNNEVDCKLKITLGENVTAKLVSVSNAGSKVPTQDSVTLSTGSKMDEVSMSNDTSSASSPADTSGMLKLESKLGYTAYFPKTLTFKQVGVEDLGLSGITCLSKVNAINYKDKDNLETNPSVEVFVCKTKLGDSEVNALISGKGLLYKKSQATDYIFLIRSSGDGSAYANQIIFE